jgi:hypothetical protein
MKRFAIALGLSVIGCTWETDLPDAARDIHVDASRELLVTDDAILAQDHLGFRHAMSSLSLGNDATIHWLDAWSARLRDEGHADRAASFESSVTCRWLRATPSNACDDRCASCSARTLSLDDAPFRLIAIANRTDLSVMPDRAADGGEGRLVFALTDGDSALPMTVIFEYAQIGTALEWSQRWHALGTAADFPTALVSVTDRFVGAGTIAQIRTADALTGPMLLHQFVALGGELVASNVRNSPDWSRVDPAAVRDFADANADAIAAGTAVVPRAWWAASSGPADQPPVWVAGVREHEALVRQTCGGCHAQAENGFQIDPQKKADSRCRARPTTRARRDRRDGSC